MSKVQQDSEDRESDESLDSVETDESSSGSSSDSDYYHSGSDIEYENDENISAPTARYNSMIALEYSIK